MTCPKCNEKTKVISSRAETDCIERIRKCVSCRYCFTSFEIDKDLYERILRNDKRQRKPQRI